ncbi:MAG: hypothetical protein LBV39_00025 [Bacteroidales bacterium]|nr:hypothetical protein [Bacteroidales bacterium]
MLVDARWLMAMCLCVVCACILPMASAQSLRNDVILKAMGDELQRNTDSLQLTGRETPFFIQYAVQRGRIFQVQATLGALTGVNDFQLGNMSVQTLVGNYQMSNINHTSPDYRAGSAVDSSPIDDNYREIRRRLWLLTDQAYKRAIETYSNKMAAIKRQNLPADVLELPDFTNLPATSCLQSAPVMNFEQEYWKKTALECSAVLKKYPDIYDSNVGIEVYSGDIYSFNSEGTQLTHPVRLIAVVVNAYTKSSDGEELSDKLSWYGRTKDELPSAKQITEAVNTMAANLLSVSAAPLMEESYTGPVMLEGEVLASAMTAGLLSQQTGLIAYRTPITSGGIQKSMEDRLHLKILSADVSIKSVPQMESYQGRPLIGSYRMDAEGVAPSELLLVENGMLRTLMCDRVPKKKIKTPTGNRVYTYQPLGISSLTSPGVLLIQTSQGLPPAELKEKLIHSAKEEGLSYAYIIRCQPNGRNAVLYKVQTADGSESPVRAGALAGIGLNRLKRALGASNQVEVANMMVGNVPLSVVYPQAMVVEEVEIEKRNLQNTTKLPTVSNPLIAKP